MLTEVQAVAQTIEALGSISAFAALLWFVNANARSNDDREKRMTVAMEEERKACDARIEKAEQRFQAERERWAQERRELLQLLQYPQSKRG